MGLNNVTGWNYMGNLWVPPQQNEARMRINVVEMDKAVTNAVKQENGLWKVKFGNNPATAFFSKEQAQNFARQQYVRSVEGQPSVFNARPTAIQQPVIQQPTVQPTAVRQPVIQQPTVQSTVAQQQYVRSITGQPTAFNMQPTAAQQQYVRSTTAQPTAAKQPIVQQPTAQPTVSNLQPQTNNTAQIKQPKKHTWTNYAQEHGTTYVKPPKSGVVIADERAAQIIAQNAEKAAQQPVVQQPTAQPAAAQQQYFHSITSQPTAAKQPIVQQPIAQPTAAQQPVVQQPSAQPAAAQQPKANEPALASEAKAKQVKTPEQRAAQLRRVRSNPEAKARYNRLKLKNNPELAERYKSYCKQVKNSGKLKGLKKAGKWGALAALAIGAVTVAVQACKGDKKDDAVKPETTQPVADTQTPAAPATPAETAPTTPAEPTNTEEIGVGEFRNGKYKVQKGDCFWNIAKQNLIEEYKKAQTAKNEAIDENYMPTDAEILKETERLVEKNDYEFDSRHWNTTKPIYEGDILNIAA